MGISFSSDKKIRREFLHHWFPFKSKTGEEFLDYMDLLWRQNPANLNHIRVYLILFNKLLKEDEGLDSMEFMEFKNARSFLVSSPPFMYVRGRNFTADDARMLMFDGSLNIYEKALLSHYRGSVTL